LIPFLSRVAIIASLILLAGSAPPVRAAGPETLADSTEAENWTLANGLQVVTRHVPRARGIAVVMCYRIGSASDPAGHEGESALLAELQYRGGSTDSPERSREELTILRPLGWNLKVTPYLCHLAEIATPAQFPGMLHQIASRTRGVTVSEALLQSAVREVKRDLADNYGGSVERALYYDVRGLATGIEPAGLNRYATGKGIEGISVREAQQRLQSVFTPANAVLSLAGNLSGYDVHRLVEREFAGIPAGNALPRPKGQTLKKGVYRLTAPNLPIAVGAIGVLGPALDDTLHPSFTLHALLMGSFCRGRWGPTDPPLTTRFDFSPLDDPEVVRFYPPISPDPKNTVVVVEELHYTLAEVPVQLERNAYVDALDNVAWMLGGAMPDFLVRRMQREPGALYTLASGMGARAQWGDEAFWSEYRRRFDASAGRDLPIWRNYFGALDHIVQLRLVPETAAAK
jgi:hypothetical protein